MADVQGQEPEAADIENGGSGGDEINSDEGSTMADVQEEAAEAGDKVSDGAKPALSKKKKRMSRAQRRKQKQQKEQKEQRQENPDRFDKREIIKDNENMVKFYKSQPLFDDKEFEQFMECLRTTLPASFRINTFDYDQAQLLRQLVERQFQDYLKSGEATIEPVKVEAGAETVATEPPAAVPTLDCLEWYPKRMAWQMNVTRIDLRKSSILRSLHTFIQAETDNGYVSRQESVSMIPPLVLDVHRGQNILDMCAAPGSKTAQLLEYLKFSIHDSDGQQQQHQSVREKQEKSLFRDGLVVANDVDNKRCYMLVHQSKRLNSPNCVIINEDASRLPKMQRVAGDDGQDNDNEDNELKFDRILCDAPCSGDGTVRKNPDVWRKWTIGNANNFHGLQSKILRRGVELLAENGLIVYSTCSMNPVEDEAVVANILRMGEGKLVLEDCSAKIQGLKYRPGLESWLVMDTNMEVVSAFDQVKPERTSQLHRSIFPPSAEELKHFNLKRCIRIFPHYQNTGAFFVAVIRKLAARLPHELRERPTYVDSEGRLLQPKPKRRRLGFKEDPFVFVARDDKDLAKIKQFYGLSDEFPEGQLTHRCKSTSKGSIYLVSRQTRDFIQANSEVEGRTSFVKIINAGMRLFTKASETEAGFRLCQDGVNEVLAYVKQDLKVPISKRDLTALLERKSVPFQELSAAEHFKDRLRMGSCILIYKHDNQGEGEQLQQQQQQGAEMPLVAWRGVYGIALYVSDKYKVHLRSLVQGKIVDVPATAAVATKTTPANGEAQDHDQETKTTPVRTEQDCASEC